MFAFSNTLHAANSAMLNDFLHLLTIEENNGERSETESGENEKRFYQKPSQS